MLLGLAEANIAPDLVVGTSVGAVNGGWVAAQSDVVGIRRLADVWRSLSRNDVFPARPVTGLLGFLGVRSNLVPAAGLRRLLKRTTTIARSVTTRSTITIMIPWMRCESQCMSWATGVVAGW